MGYILNALGSAVRRRATVVLRSIIMMSRCSHVEEMDIHNNRTGGRPARNRGRLYSWHLEGHSGGVKSAKPANSENIVKRVPQQVVSVDTPKDSYDLIVVGTDLEGFAAAVSGARNGLRTLLVDDRGRDALGGLMTVGWLNSIDMNWNRTSPPLPGQEQDYYNKGLFAEWYKKTEGHSFDVVTAWATKTLGWP